MQTFNPFCSREGMRVMLPLGSLLYLPQMSILQAVTLSGLIELKAFLLMFKQFSIPSSYEHHCPPFKLAFDSNSFEYLQKGLIFRPRSVIIALCRDPFLPQHSPQILYSSIRQTRSWYLSQKNWHPADSRSFLQDFSQYGISCGSIKLCVIIHSTLLMQRSAKLRTGFPIRIPFNWMGLLAFVLDYNILRARSGIYLPAQDSPAIRKMLFTYYGNLLVKKSFNAKRLSLAVLGSSQVKSGSLLILYPTPAGESMNKRLLILVQAQWLKMRSPPALQYGEIYCTKPIFDTHPGPTFIHNSTGILLLTPLFPSRNTQCSFLRSDSVLRYPAQARLPQLLSYPGMLASRSLAGSQMATPSRNSSTIQAI